MKEKSRYLSNRQLKKKYGKMKMNGIENVQQMREREEAHTVQLSDGGEFKERYIRLLADIDNLRKRYARDIERQKNLDREEIFREFLPVIDNMERALSTAERPGDPLYEGIKANYNLMLGFLKKFNVERFACVNDTFDPHIHEALYIKKDPGKEDGKITEVLEPGYKIKDTILRPAKVVPVKNN